MITDYEDMFGLKVPLAGLTQFPGIMDHGLKGSYSPHDELFFVLQSNVTAVGGTGAQFVLEGSDEADFSSDVSVLVDTGEIPVARLVPGNPLYSIRAPQSRLRYKRLRVVPNGAFTAGEVSAFLTTTVQENYTYDNAEESS